MKGIDYLSRRVNRLLESAVRLSQETADETERLWAERLILALEAFKVQEWARTKVFDVNALIGRQKDSRDCDRVRDQIEK